VRVLGVAGPSCHNPLQNVVSVVLEIRYLDAVGVSTRWRRQVEEVSSSDKAN
jgi:hypothetical protein